MSEKPKKKITVWTVINAIYHGMVAALAALGVSSCTPLLFQFIA